MNGVEDPTWAQSLPTLPSLEEMQAAVQEEE
jgi:hypothetical protein